ncbi:glycosyltransferase [Paraburkholderia sp. A3BS-1L]|uniref:glycosyltransferase family protein n=1 Tax=Paraburkholderia sp. A3BS-1L TaxID=3028375 RepID=UPI003DA8F4B1
MNPNKFRILLLDTKFRNPNHYICLAILKALGRSAEVEFVAKAGPLDAMSVASANHCNLFIAFDGEELDATICARIAAVCGRSVLWVTEDPYELEVNQRRAQLFDLVFTNDSSSVAAYGEKGRHLPLASALEFHSLPVRRPDLPFRYDLFFAGTAWPNRSAFIRSVVECMPEDWKFKFALPTNPFLPPHGVKLPASMLSWRTSPVDFARFANASAITLLLPRVFSASQGREYAETPPPRLFEAALAGSVQMVHESLREVSLAFEPDKEIVLFSTEDDFFAKARKLIRDRSYRDAIAEASRQRALAEHLYDHRVTTILQHAGGIKKAALHVDRDDVRTVLFVVHNVAHRGNFGGVEVYLERLRKRLGPKWRVLFYVAGSSDKDSLLLAGDYEQIQRFTFRQEYSAGLLTCAQRESALREIIVNHKIDLVHFHHFIGHVPSLIYVARQMGVPSAFTAHDFFPVCNEFNLISFKGDFCGAPDVTIAQCDVCLSEKRRIKPGSQAQRREFWNDALRYVDMLIFNTEGGKQTYSRTYPSVRQHSRAIVLPVPIPDRPAARGQRGGVLKVAVLGNVTLQKGGDVLSRVFPMLKDERVEFHVFGRVDPEYARLVSGARPNNVVVHGSYSIDAPPDALRECDVSLHVSIWPETYCLTLSEAWQVGLVPIVTDIGALGERVVHGVNGLKVAPGSEGALIDSIRRLIDDTRLLETLRANISDNLYARLEPHLDALRSEYRSLLRLRQPAVPIVEPIMHPTLADMGVVVQSSSWYHGNHEGSGLSGGVAGRLMFKARRLAAFYRRTGWRQTVHVVVNRIRR